MCTAQETITPLTPNRDSLVGLWNRFHDVGMSDEMRQMRIAQTPHGFKARIPLRCPFEQTGYCLEATLQSVFPGRKRTLPCQIRHKNNPDKVPTDYHNFL